VIINSKICVLLGQWLLDCFDFSLRDGEDCRPTACLPGSLYCL